MPIPISDQPACGSPRTANRGTPPRGTLAPGTPATAKTPLPITRPAEAHNQRRLQRGRPSTIREFLAAGLIDYLHIVVVPIVLGRGERLWDGLEALEDRFQIEAVNSPSGVTHVTLSRR